MFQAPKLTNAGKDLYYRNMGSEPIQFTAIQMGNGNMTGPIATMTALVNSVVTINAAVKVNTDYVEVSGRFSNAELVTGFYWREIGIFAANPDHPESRAADILYCYQNAYDTADFIPVASVETVEKNITIPVIVGDATNVSCILSSSLIVATTKDLEEHSDDTTKHVGPDSKNNPIDGDSLVLADAADGGKLKCFSWSAMKSALSFVFASTMHFHTWGDITGKPTSFTPSAHKSSHATGGADALCPGDIRAANAIHSHDDKYYTEEEIDIKFNSIQNATTTKDGLMSSEDKTKMDGIAADANNYTHPSTHAASMINQDSTHRFVTEAEKTEWNGKVDSIVVNKAWNKNASYETAGAFTWVAPDLFNGKPYKIGVMIIGGGGSGALTVTTASPSTRRIATGGASGFSLSFVKEVSPNQSINLIVGAKGTKNTVSDDDGVAQGVAGGSSSFNGVVVNGGEGGNAGSTSNYPDGGKGGQNSSPYGKGVSNPFGGIIFSHQDDDNDRLVVDSNSCFNPFESIRILGAGGIATCRLEEPETISAGGKDPLTGLGGGHGASRGDDGTGDFSAEDASLPGCGGGALAVTSYVNGTISSGAGADGAVYIYARGVTT